MFTPKRNGLMLLLFLALFTSTLGFAQSSSKKSSSKKSAAASPAAGTIGLGVKLGDPTGASVKFYNQSSAIELVVGRPYYFRSYYNDYGYYKKRFYKYDRFNYEYYKFDRYAAGRPLAVQLHFLKSKPTKNFKDLQIYYGLGPQFSAYRVEYFYYDDRYKNVVYSDSFLAYDLGLDGVFGLEYTFSDMPLSVFGDVNLFVEILDEPLRLGLQGGIGIRYNF